MLQRRSRLAWILVLIGLPVGWVAGVWLYMSFAASDLHPTRETVPSVTHSQPSPQWAEAVNRARRTVLARVSEQNLPGVSVAVGVGDALVWAEGFGWSDLKARVPVTPDTRFRIGTASTMLTSAAAGLLWEEGRLKLDDEIQAYVPEFPKKQWPVTLRQLMAHEAGLGTDGGDDGPLFYQRCERPVEALPHFAQSALLFEPGTQYRHSKYGWVLVSSAIEAAAAQPFRTFMSEQIFRPLGMEHTGAESAAEENPEKVGEEAEDPPFLTFLRQGVLEPLGMAAADARPATAPALYYLPGFGNPPIVHYGVHVMRTRNLSCYAGSMAFLSTPSDLVRFGLGIGVKLLRPETVRLLQTPQQLQSGQQTNHGLGWDLRTVTVGGEPRVTAGQDGDLQGRPVGSVMMFREGGIVVAVMSNIPRADTPALASKVAEEFAQATRR